MSVTKYAQINIAGISLSAHPVHYICSTTAELPGSGLKLGDTALVVDTNIQYKAASTTTWTAASASSTNVPSQFIVKAADESVTSSSTLQNDNELFFPMVANEVWMVTATLWIDSSAVAMKCGVAVPSGATVRWGTSSYFTGPEAGVLPQRTEAQTISPNPGATGAGLYSVKFYYRAVNGSTGGNFQLTWAQDVSNATATNMRKYSTLAALKVA